MLYRQKHDSFIRMYGDGDSGVGYVMNAAAFDDRAVDASGAVFLAALSRVPQSLDAIVDVIMRSFVDADRAQVRADAVELFAALEAGGFIVSGENPEELDRKDTRFSYAALERGTAPTAPDPYDTEQKIRELLDKHFIDKPHLRQFQIELTSRCNERCTHCYIPHENKISDIEPNLYCQTLEQCREMGVLGLTLSGGEPLLHPLFCDFLRKAKECDFSVNVLSNLTLLNDDIIAVMRRTRLSSVQVSLYSMDAAVHDSITCLKGSFQKTLFNIQRLIENDIPVQIACPVMKQNKDSFHDVVVWAQKNKLRPLCDYIMMARYDHTTGNLENRLNLCETAEVIKAIMEYDEEYQQEIRNLDIGRIETEDTGESVICGVGVASACMVANGNIYPCAGWQGYVCGNVRDTPLREIWENSPKVKYLRGLRKKDFPKCVRCPDKSFCAMCMVRNANENPGGDPLKINEHFCKVAALNRKIVLDWKAKLQEA